MYFYIPSERFDNKVGLWGKTIWHRLSVIKAYINL